jgi:predicted transcriptional regulator
MSSLENELDMLERHIDILKKIKENEPVGIIKLSEITKYPQHTVRYSMRLLSQDFLINPTQHGAITTDAINRKMEIIKLSLEDIHNRIARLIELI